MVCTHPSYVMNINIGYMSWIYEIQYSYWITHLKLLNTSSRAHHANWLVATLHKFSSQHRKGTMAKDSIPEQENLVSIKKFWHQLILKMQWREILYSIMYVIVPRLRYYYCSVQYSMEHPVANGMPILNTLCQQSDWRWAGIETVLNSCTCLTLPNFNIHNVI